MSELRCPGWLLLLAALSTAGCAPAWVDAKVREPNKALPAAFVADAASADAPGTGSVGHQDWRSFFADGALTGLVDVALRNNRELDIRLQEIIIARAEVAARRGEYLPRLDAVAGVGVDRVGLHTSQGLSDERHGVGQTLGDFSFGLRASWEIDVWGRLRTAANAAELRVRAAIEGRNFLVTQIVAEIARSYYEVAALDGQLAVLDQMIVLQERALEMLHAEKQAARSNQLAVLRFEAELLRNRARIFDLRQRRVQAANRINFLLGRYPQPIHCADGALAVRPPAALATGLPSALLDDRPDVRRAAAELRAAKLDVRAARARFYPSLSIDAAAGYRAFDPKHLLYTPDSMIANLAGNLVAPLLNRAGIEAAYRTASAQQVQAVLDYEQTLLRAFTEVANAVARLQNLQRRYALQSEQVHKLEQAAETSTLLFQSARADYMEVLLTRRDWLDAELELIETRQELRAGVVDLYQALGGGWRSAS